MMQIRRLSILGLVCTLSLVAQNQDIKAIAANLEQQINTAIDSGDFTTASKQALALMHLFNAEMQKNAPNPDQRLSNLESAYATATGDARFLTLLRLPRAAFAAGDVSKAEQYARTLLTSADQYKKNVFYGDALFEGNEILGRVLLRSGDVSSAKNLLIASVGAGGVSPWLSNVGPDMGLGQDLLNRGERTTVAQFLSICKTFWTGAESANLDVWIAAINGGATPVLKPRRDW
jgi:hypothetical protein